MNEKGGERKGLRDYTLLEVQLTSITNTLNQWSVNQSINRCCDLPEGGTMPHTPFPLCCVTRDILKLGVERSKIISGAKKINHPTTTQWLLYSIQNIIILYRSISRYNWHLSDIRAHCDYDPSTDWSHSILSEWEKERRFHVWLFREWRWDMWWEKGLDEWIRG